MLLAITNNIRLSNVNVQKNNDVIRCFHTKNLINSHVVENHEIKITFSLYIQFCLVVHKNHLTNDTKEKLFKRSKSLQDNSRTFKQYNFSKFMSKVGL